MARPSSTCSGPAAGPSRHTEPSPDRRGARATLAARAARAGWVAAAWALAITCPLAHAAPGKDARPAAAPTAEGAPPSHTAEGLAAQAAAVAKRGDFKLAAKMFHAAYALDRSAWDYLYSAARAEQLGGEIEAAQRDYEVFLAGAPAEHPLRARAKTYAAEVERAHAEAMHRRRAQAEIAAQAARRAEQSQSLRGVGRVLGWAALGLGASALAGGGIWYAAARSDKDALEAKTATSAGAPIRTISYHEAQSEANAIRADLRLGVSAMGVGAGIAALGAWLVWTTRAPAAPRAAVSLLPSASGGATLTLAWPW